MSNHTKVALITGIGGQDGSYLSEFLLKQDYKVRGIIRRASSLNTHRIEHLVKQYGTAEDLNSPFSVVYGDVTDASSIRAVIEKTRPDEIYNLGAQSHVGISFDNAESTININTLGTLRVLEALKDMRSKCKLYQASSSEMFGISPPPQNENTPMLPQSPYGVSKLAAYHLTKLYRNAYDLFASNGILFNHESPRRGYNFATKKVTQTLADILVGEQKDLVMGNLDAKRDWGFSGDYVQAMHKILQHNVPDDFVIATEETHTVRDFIQESFSLVGLDYEKFLKTNPKFKRPAEVPALLGDASKARKVLGWEPKVKFKELVAMMVESDLKENFEKKGIVPVKMGEQYAPGYFTNIGKELARKL